MRYITTNQLIALVNDKLGGNLEIDRPCQDYIWQALNKIGLRWRDSACAETVVIEDCKADKPCNFHIGHDIRVVFEHPSGNGCGVIYPILRTKSWCKKPAVNGSVNFDRSSMNVNHGITVSEESTFFSFSSQVADLTNPVAEILYTGYPIDSNGEFIIPEEYEVAVMRYCEWQLKEYYRNRNVNTWGISDLTNAREEWLRELRNTRKLKNMPSPMEMREIAAKWVTMVGAVGRGRDFEYVTDNYIPRQWS